MMFTKLAHAAFKSLVKRAQARNRDVIDRFAVRTNVTGLFQEAGELLRHATTAGALATAP